MTKVAVLGTGLVYRNPKPHLRSVHAYFPSVAQLTNGDLLCLLVLGEAFEAANCHTYVTRSVDRGATWQVQGELSERLPDRLASDSARLTALPGGKAVAFMVRADRSAHPEEGLTNPENIGFVPTETLLLRSDDCGHRWQPPQPLVPPLVGPAFEICCPIVPLRDGRWLLPTSTWRGWDGACPNGMKMVALVSHDQGQSWPEHLDVMADPAGQVIYWESKIAELPDGRLLAVAWAYDQGAARDLPNQFALSTDGGHSWTGPRSTGLQGQTLTPHVLLDGGVLSVYRRIDRAGLWANLSRVDGDRWVNDDEAPLWGAAARGLTGTSESMLENFQALRFGAPSLARLDDGSIFLAFWCYEDCVSVIRWFRLTVE